MRYANGPPWSEGAVEQIDILKAIHVAVDDFPYYLDFGCCKFAMIMVLQGFFRVISLPKRQRALPGRYLTRSRMSQPLLRFSCRQARYGRKLSF